MIYSNKVYAEMYIQCVANPWNDWKKYPIPACGSDSIFYCDNRKNHDTMIRDAKEYAEKMNRKLNKGFIGVRLMRNDKPVSEVNFL